MAALRDAYLFVLEARSMQRSSFMVAVTLIRGVNDGISHARELVELLRPFQESDKCKGVMVCSFFYLFFYFYSSRVTTLDALELEGTGFLD